MAFYRKKPVVIEASQWFKNGDHPLDGSRLITPVPGDGEPYLSEGDVVRRYRHPDVPGDPWGARGWVTIGIWAAAMAAFAMWAYRRDTRRT